MQCENHNDFFQICLAFDWVLWESGTDTTCVMFPEHVPILLRPCPWDLEQQEPVGCLCCTDLNQALGKFHDEMRSWMESRLINPEFTSLREIERIWPAPADRGEPLGPAPEFLPSYVAR